MFEQVLKFLIRLLIISKMSSRITIVHLLGMLLWVMSIHGGSFGEAFGKRSLNFHYQTSDQVPIVNVTQEELDESLSISVEVMDRLMRLEENLISADILVKKGTPSHGEAIVSAPELDTIRQGKDSLVLSKATAHLSNIACPGFDAKVCAKELSKIKLDSTSFAHVCRQLRKHCSPEDIYSPYRSEDGSCNFFDKKTKLGHVGKSSTTYRRLLHPQYLNGVFILKRSVNKTPLPSARMVSTALVEQSKDDDFWRTMAVMVWSQFVEHDLAHTAMSKMMHNDNNIECCNPKAKFLSPRYVHPFCLQIESRKSEMGFDNVNCMSYVRSIPGISNDCTFGPLQQINQATHFLDGSQIYGSTFRKSVHLRSFENGKLKTSMFENRPYLPLSKNPTQDCQTSSNKTVCFISGDSRVNFQPDVSSMYTLWVREHNRVAEKLSHMNPQWDDEYVFQEARKIVIAEMQHITYEEWLPLILGNDYTTQFAKDYYEEKTDPSVSNAFATAAIRAFSSLADGDIKLFNEDRKTILNLPLQSYFNNPGVVQKSDNFDSILRGMTTQSCQKIDLAYPEDIINKLFANGNAFGLDILSLDIQRGRDHGLPGYTHYRKVCGLGMPKTFQDLSDLIEPSIVQSLSEIYSHPNDIDLLIGALAESPEDGAIVGPTLSCVLADQFVRTKRADRYFYTNSKQPSPFSTSQLNEIKKVTLARIICDNSNDVEYVQKEAFRKISNRNKLISCDNLAIPSLNLELWNSNRNKYQ